MRTFSSWVWYVLDCCSLGLPLTMKKGKQLDERSCGAGWRWLSVGILETESSEGPCKRLSSFQQKREHTAVIGS